MDSSKGGKFGVENRVGMAKPAPTRVATRVNTRARRVLCDIENLGGRPAKQPNGADDIKAEKSRTETLVADMPMARKFGVNLTNKGITTRASSLDRDGKQSTRPKLAESNKVLNSGKLSRISNVDVPGKCSSTIGIPKKASAAGLSGKLPKISTSNSGIPKRSSTTGLSHKPPRDSNPDILGKHASNPEIPNRPSIGSFSVKQSTSSVISNTHSTASGSGIPPRPLNIGVSRKGTLGTAKLKICPPKAKAISKKIQPADAQKRKGRPKKTFTSTLTARSEAALGHSQPERIEEEDLPNIDEADNENHLAVVDYVQDIYHFYWDVEARKCPSSSYMSSQVEISPRMRAILIDWLIDVHLKFELMPETLFLMTNLIDRFLSIHVITRKDFQLVGLTALLVASKYEEIWPPKIDDLVEISKNSYIHDQMLSMEKLMLNKLRFYLTVPTPYVFMKRFLKAAQADEELERLSFYLVELCLVEYEALQWKPSMLAASAIYIAHHILQRMPPWTRLLQKHAHYIETDLKECTTMIARFHVRAEKNDLQVVRNKYLSTDFGSVAKLPYATSLMPEN